MHTRLVCSYDQNGLRHSLKINDDDMTILKAVKIELEMEDGTKVAMKTLHGSRATTTLTCTAVCRLQKKAFSAQKGTSKSSRQFPEIIKTNNYAISCCFLILCAYSAIKKADVGEVCIQEKKSMKSVGYIRDKR